MAAIPEQVRPNFRPHGNNFLLVTGTDLLALTVPHGSKRRLDTSLLTITTVLPDGESVTWELDENLKNYDEGGTWLIIKGKIPQKKGPKPVEGTDGLGTIQVTVNGGASTGDQPAGYEGDAPT